MAVRARYGFSHVFTIRMRSRGPTYNSGLRIDEVVAARATDGCVSGHDPVGVARTRYCGMSMYRIVAAHTTHDFVSVHDRFTI